MNTCERCGDELRKDADGEPIAYHVLVGRRGVMTCEWRLCWSCWLMAQRLRPNAPEPGLPRLRDGAS